MSVVPVIDEPGKYNLTIYRGATLQRTFTWTVNGAAQSFTGITLSGNISDANYTTTLLDLASYLSASGTTLTLKVPQDQTLALDPVGNARWGLYLADTGGNRIKLLTGSVVVTT